MLNDVLAGVDKWAHGLQLRDYVPASAFGEMLGFGEVLIYDENSCHWVPFFEVGPFDSKATLIICNHSAPSLVKSTIAACVWKMLVHMVTSNPESTMGIFMSPTFAYSKGSLFAEEYAILRTLSNAGCYVDGVFQINFEGKSKTELCPKISSCLLS